MVAKVYGEMQESFSEPGEGIERFSVGEPRILYGKRDAARMLSISVRKVEYLISDGRLRASRCDGRVLIHIDELRRFAKKL